MRMLPDDGPAYASAAHAARLIGRSDRIVQLWMREAGHEDAWVPNAGYPVALLCAVVNDHKWPNKFRVTPEHFNSDADHGEIAADPDPQGTHENTAALALLNGYQQTLAAIRAGQEADRATLAELRAQVAQLVEDNRRLRERDEKAAQSRQDATRDTLAALERIEQGQRRKGWWARILGR